MPRTFLILTSANERLNQLLQEMYNNIVIYIVGHPPEESPSPNEMHIFQCVNVSARLDLLSTLYLISGIYN